MPLSVDAAETQHEFSGSRLHKRSAEGGRNEFAASGERARHAKAINRRRSYSNLSSSSGQSGCLKYWKTVFSTHSVRKDRKSALGKESSP